MTEGHPKTMNLPAHDSPIVVRPAPGALKRFAHRLHADDRGAMSVEKILIIGLIALPIIIALFVFRTLIVGWFKGQKDQLSDPGTYQP